MIVEGEQGGLGERAMNEWCCRHPSQLGLCYFKFFLVDSNPFYYLQIGEGYASPTPITPRFVSSMMSQLPVPWTFFCALYILGMDEATLEQSIQLSSWDQVTDLRKH